MKRLSKQQSISTKLMVYNLKKPEKRPTLIDMAGQSTTSARTVLKKTFLKKLFKHIAYLATFRWMLRTTLVWYAITQTRSGWKSSRNKRLEVH